MTLAVRILALLLPLLSVHAVGQEDTVTVRKLRGLVVVREGPGGTERTLYDWDATTQLREGDQLEQGSSAHSVLLVPSPDPEKPELQGTTVVELNAPARVVIEETGVAGDTLRVPWVTVARIQVGPRPLTLFLPAALVLDAVDTEIHIRLEPGRLHIRNSGGSPLHLSVPRAAEPGGDGLRQVTVARGEEVRVPLFLAPEGVAGEGTGRWGALAVDYDDAADLQSQGWRLTVSGQKAPGWVSLGGVRTRARPGGRLVVSNHRRFGAVYGADAEPEAIPAPAAEPPPAETPPAESTEPEAEQPEAEAAEEEGP